MAECHRLEGCPFFKDTLRDMPAAAGMYKKQFCLEDNTDCARNYLYIYIEAKNYDIDDATEAVMERLSLTLCPNQIGKVKKLFPLD